MRSTIGLLSFITLSEAQTIRTGGSWLGGYDANDEFFSPTVQAAQEPNLTISAKVEIGKGLFDVRVNLSDTSAAEFGIDRVSVRSYDLSWNSSSSSTMNMHLGAPRLCVTYAYWTFPPDVINAYQPSESGSCVSAFGDACERALRVVSYDLSPSVEAGCHIAELPSECEAVFPLGRNESKVVGDSYNLNYLDRIRNNSTSPLPIFYNTSSIPYTSSNAAAFEFERDRLHFLLLGDGSSGSSPVCLRLSANVITSTSAYQDWNQSSSPTGAANSTTSRAASAKASAKAKACLSLLAGVAFLLSL